MKVKAVRRVPLRDVPGWMIHVRCRGDCGGFSCELPASSWSTSGPDEAPSFSPSVRVLSARYKNGEPLNPPHFFVSDGFVSHCADSCCPGDCTLLHADKVFFDDGGNVIESA